LPEIKLKRIFKGKSNKKNPGIYEKNRLPHGSTPYRRESGKRLLLGYTQNREKAIQKVGTSWPRRKIGGSQLKMRGSVISKRQPRKTKKNSPQGEFL